MATAPTNLLEKNGGVPEDNSGGTGDRFYFLVDIGANLTNKKFSRDVDSVVARAKEAGVLKIMVKQTKTCKTIYVFIYVDLFLKGDWIEYCRE